MVAITDYSTLVQAIKDEAENDGLEFAEFIPTAIGLAEEKLLRELDLPELEEEVTGTLGSASNVITKPSGYKHSDALFIKEAGVKKPLKKKFKNFLDDYWPNETLTGTPKYYADLSATQFIVAPTSNAALPYSLRCTKKPQGLSATNTTNYYVESCSDILFYAIMVEMVKFMKAWSQVPAWESYYNRSQESWNVQAMRYRRDGTTTPHSPDNGPNSLKHTAQTKA